MRPTIFRINQGAEVRPSILTRLTQHWSILALLAIFGYALSRRLQELRAAISMPLWPDAVTVFRIAQNMRYPYDSGVREPLWPWLVKLFLWVFGTSEASVRYFSLTISLIGLYVAYRFIRDYTGSAGLALLALSLLALNPYLTMLSVQGLRIELYMVTLLVLGYYVFVPRLSPWTRRVGLAVSTTLAALTQLNSVTIAAPLLVWAVWRHRLNWRTVGIVLGPAALLVLPHLINSTLQFGDPLWSINAHAIFYRNYEYMAIKKTGCDGCPSAEEYSRSSYSGKRVTTFQYVFGMHSLREVFSRMGEGYLSVYVKRRGLLQYVLGTGRRPVWLLYLVGLAGLAAGRFRELLILPLLELNLLAFIVPLDIDPRLIIHTAPVAALATALPGWYVARHLVSRLNTLTYHLRPGQHRAPVPRSEEHTSELQSRLHLVCRLLLEKKKHTRTKLSAV